MGFGKTYSNTLLTKQFFWVFSIPIVLFMISYAVPVLFPFALAVLGLIIVATIIDFFFVFQPSIKFTADRKLPKALSLGDQNNIQVSLENHSPYSFDVTVIDEIPIQFQQRGMEKTVHLTKKSTTTIAYNLRPTGRGEYTFKHVNLLLKSPIGLIQRRYIIDKTHTIPVFPSVIQMKKYGLLALQKTSNEFGSRKLKRLGSSYEFDQITNYNQGDDYRDINWKASSKRGELMVNKYIEERSQRVYSILDKGRSMQMPFNELSLLDYSNLDHKTLCNY